MINIYDLMEILEFRGLLYLSFFMKFKKKKKKEKRLNITVAVAGDEVGVVVEWVWS